MLRSRLVVLAMVGDGKGKRSVDMEENMEKKGGGKGKYVLNFLNWNAHDLMENESLGQDTEDTENGVQLGYVQSVHLRSLGGYLWVQGMHKDEMGTDNGGSEVGGVETVVEEEGTCVEDRIAGVRRGTFLLCLLVSVKARGDAVDVVDVDDFGVREEEVVVVVAPPSQCDHLERMETPG